MLGTLFGIGVGPGDPELLTIKAARILKEVSHVFAASSSKNDYSLAYSIVSQHLREGATVEQLAFPMTFKAEQLENAWRANCEKVSAILEQGQNVAFLTLGDPLIYSTFAYLMRKVRNRFPQVNITVVPAITSFQAAAACAREPLVEGEETLTIVSGAKGTNRLAGAIDMAENVVIMKTYKHFPQILGKLREEGLEERFCFVSRCGLEGQIVEHDFTRLAAMEEPPNYLSLMIIKKNGMCK
ncbi:MAG: precorrin-2 C(20)-methyltransferase [Syntrophobacteraceae bacterium]